MRARPKVVSAIVRALPARNLAIINGHGGNRGVLENLLHEFHGDFGLNACVIHPFDLAQAPSTPAAPDVHGGRNETSIMLALAPAQVRMALVDPPVEPPDQGQKLIPAERLEFLHRCIARPK